MSHELVIEIEPWEERVAVREGGALAEFYLERPGDLPRVGSVYAGRVVGTLAGVRAALLDIGEGEPAFLPLRDPVTAETAPVSRGQVLLVQVTKRPLGGKRAQVTRQVSLPGRLAVLTPGVRGVKVSRRIEDEREHARLEGLLAGMMPPDSGLLARTAAKGRGGAELESAVGELTAEWDGIQARMKGVKAPALMRQEEPLRMRALRDLTGPGIERIRAAPGPAGEELRAAIRTRYPELEGLLAVETEPGLFWRTGIETELEQILDRQVFLRGGGSLVIETMEALTVVDVNSGSPAGEGSPEEVALRTNLEAAQEVPRQLRLRGIGGIIVVDFIDMPDPDHWKQVMDVLESSLRRDRVRTQVAAVSPFGVVEMTRKRVDETTYHHLTEACPACGGTGRVLSPSTVAILVVRRVIRALKSGGKPPVVVRANPRLGWHLREDSKLLRGILGGHGEGTLSVVDDPSLACEDFVVSMS